VGTKPHAEIVKRPAADADAANDIHPVPDVDLKVAVSNHRSSVTGSGDLASPRRVLLASLEYSHGLSRLSETERYGRSAKPGTDYDYIEFPSYCRFIV